MGRPKTAGPRRELSRTPGPGEHDPYLDAAKYKSPAFSMGRPKSAKPKAGPDEPGPGAYSPTSITHYHSPSFSMGNEIQRREHKPDATPGPGTYPPNMATRVRAPAWDMKSKRTSSFEGIEATPGPGQYFDANEGGEAYSEITRFGGKMLASASNEWARNYGHVSTSNRFEGDF